MANHPPYAAGSPSVIATGSVRVFKCLWQSAWRKGARFKRDPMPAPSTSARYRPAGVRGQHERSEILACRPAARAR